MASAAKAEISPKIGSHKWFYGLPKGTVLCAPDSWRAVASDTSYRLRDLSTAPERISQDTIKDSPDSPMTEFMKPGKIGSPNTLDLSGKKLVLMEKDDLDNMDTFAHEFSVGVLNDDDTWQEGRDIQVNFVMSYVSAGNIPPKDYAHTLPTLAVDEAQRPILPLQHAYVPAEKLKL
ncbi:MAG: hypothetical protein SFW62_07040 [Alphaproteobacteria bacterium]|nr:hypothetical protein [Alphaproteobacteria bacterium]